MQKLQSQGVHHITLVGADRQTSIDFWEGVLGMPFVFEQPNLDVGDREPPLFRSRRRAADHRLHRRDAQARSDADRARPGQRPPHRLLRVARDLPAGGRPPRRARHLAQRSEGPRLHGLRSTSAIRSACSASSPPTASSRRPALTHVEVLMEAHKLRVARGDPNIAEVHLADAIENLTRERRESLSDEPRAEGSLRARGAAQGERAKERAQGAASGLIRSTIRAFADSGRDTRPATEEGGQT